MQPKAEKSGVAIIADDLTSAADGGAPFQQRGLRVEVQRGANKPSRIDCDVFAVDCQSRSLPADKAADVTSSVATTLTNCRWLYKTIDSTLRGNIRAEIQAAFEGANRSRIVIAPAFPDAGRVTRNGIQYVDGVRVCQSSYARDPVHPVLSSRISDYIPAGIRNAIILDAESQSELDEQVAALDGDDNTLWVGSPGMAIALSRLQSTLPERQQPKPSVNRVLVVIGSANPVSINQAKALEALPDVCCLTTPVERSEAPRDILNGLVDRALEEIPICDALIATGGDTMEAILDRLGISHFELVGELEPGFPIAVARKELNPPLLLAMKAGGFGTPMTLFHAARALTGQKQ